MSTSVIEVRGLGKRFRLGEQRAAYGTLRDSLASAFRRRADRGEGGAMWALRDVDFTVGQGDALGIIGANGAGKSTLLKILSRITEPTEGLVRTRGRVGVLLEVGTGFHPELTGRENVFLSGAVMGMTRKDIRRHYEEIVAFSGVEQFLDTPLKRYSSGMQLRLAFAVAAHLEPELMLVDEILAVGDIAFQRKCLQRMTRLSEEGRTLIFVSHDLGAVARLCTRAILLENGRVARDADPGEVIEAYYSTVLGGAGEVTFAVGDEVGLKHLAIVNEAGDVVAQPTRGEPLRLRARIVAERGVPHVDFSVYVRASDGSVVFHEAWGDQPSLPTLLDEAGECAVTVRIPPILRAGDYTLGAWLGSPHTCYFHQEALRFSVRPQIGDRDTRLRPRAVQVEAAWSLDRV